MPESSQPYGLTVATRLLCPWDFLGKNAGVGCHALLQGVFPTQGLNPCLLHFQADSLPPSQQGSPCSLYCSAAQRRPALCAPQTAPCHTYPSFTVFWSLLKLMSIESVMPSNHLILSLPLPLLPAVFPSIRVFFNESALCNSWPKYWHLSFSISPYNEFSCLISFRIAWFDLLVVQRTFNSLLQHHSSKVSTLHHSASFMVQLSHLYMPTAKTIALTRWTFVAKSLLFNTLSRFVRAFLPGSKHLLI